MEIGVHVQSENLLTGQIRHTASAYLTLVALDKDGRPTAVPPLILETEEEIRRNREAQAGERLDSVQRRTRTGLKQVCKDGSVFDLDDILWDKLDLEGV